MAHEQQLNFCRMVRGRFPQYFTGVWVLDIGSLDVNGSNRPLFENCGYIGVDLAGGENVDFATPADQLILPEASFDTIISTECFEHDARYQATILNAVRMLKPGGLLLFTCATEGRPEHGTRRTSPQDAPLTQDRPEWADYYRNLTARDITAFLDVTEVFPSHEFSTNSATHDLYFWGLKRGTYERRTTYSFLGKEFNKDSESLRAEVRVLANRLEEGMPGYRALAQRMEESQKRNREFAAMARHAVNSQRQWQTRADTLQRTIEELRTKVLWYENTRSWKVTKGLRALTWLQRTSVQRLKKLWSDRQRTLSPAFSGEG